ncbi:MAG TPA: VTC domain-containing protein [Phycisphaerales bacterium]|nr:VTC domain-containing protein [Phycisphaerales bacterium]
MIDRLPDNHESPSLIVGRLAAEDGTEAPEAFELKVLVSSETADAVAEWAAGAGGLRPDPHADPASGGCYTTTTLYLDTPALDVYYRREGFARRRFRLRRYGEDGWAHLECKTKSGDLVHKQRTAVPLAEASRLAGAHAENGWAGDWFHGRIAGRGLLPASMVTYRRAAFVGSCPEGPLRVTIDRQARSRLCVDPGEWTPRRVEAGEGVDVLGGSAIVELKYLAALPLPFKTLMKNLTLHPGSVSKYRLGREALGSPTPAGAAKGAAECRTG